MSELSSRKEKNKAYSMRAFARDLGIGSTSLSDCLASKRKLSKTNLKKVASALNLSPMQLDRMLSDANYKSIQESADAEEIQRLELEEDSFRLISEWYYIAILNLAKTKSNQASPEWVAERLGIGREQAITALIRLQRLGYIEVTKGQLRRTTRPISTTRDIPSTAIRMAHTQNLKLAERSLWEDDVDLREFSSVIMAIDPNKIPEAKSIIMKTKRKLAKLLEQGQSKEVYSLSIQLFPMTRVQKRKTRIDQ